MSVAVETRIEPASVAISVRGLSKVFVDPRRGPVEAVRDVSFDCRYGEIFGLLGPNGAGKSTTLRMIATVLSPSSGTAVVGGADVSADPLAVRCAMGYLSSSTGLYGRLTARETLEYFGRLHGLQGKRLAARVDELLDLFGIREFAALRCEKLSTGMKQKVSIARSIVHEPRILILDEPTLGLDILVASTMLRFVERCRSEGRCVVFSTHIMSEVERLCDRVGIIHRGELRAVGTIAELRARSGAERLEDVFIRLVGEEVLDADMPSPDEEGVSA
jgi:sodium transport system ATP-binding protein